MRNHAKKIPLLAAAVAVAVVATVGALQSRTTSSQVAHEPDKHQPKYRDERWPVADYNAPEQTGFKNDARRLSKNKRYNKQGLVPKPTSKSGDSEINLVSDWEVGFPALPVEQSAVVLIGEVSVAWAYLSEDKSGIYSEFETKVERVLKNETTNLITPASDVVVERIGGRVRLPSGRIQQFGIAHQNMPGVGRRYLFFLKAGEGQSLHLLTGYELRHGLVFPLDGVHPADGTRLPQFAEYDGTGQAAFLKVLEDLLTKSQQE